MVTGDLTNLVTGRLEENLLQSKTITTQTDIEAWLRLCSQMQEPLTTIFESGLSIKPTQQQKTEVKEILQTVVERIGQFIEAEKAHSNSLATQADCTTYKAQLQSLITQTIGINQTSS